MTNKKSTLKALIASLLSVVLCLSMLVGSTFAWFTDTASTSVNKIESGTLEIELQMATAWDDDGNPSDWGNAEGETLTFRTADNRDADKILWEPGATYRLPEIRVINKGNLWLKYQIAITGIDGDAKLNEAIEWNFGGASVNEEQYYILAPNGSNDVPLPGEVNPSESPATYSDTSDFITIEGHMKEEAGNEYQGLTIDGISITVYATQQPAEFDSFDNQYDAEAPDLTDENGNILIADVGALLSFANKVNAGKTYAGETVLLTSDIDLAGYNWTPIGNVTSYPGITFAGTFDGQGHTISNMHAVDTSAINASAGFFGSITGVVQNLTIDNATVVSNHYAGGIVGYSSTKVGMKIENCKVTNSTITSKVELLSDGSYNNGDKAGGIIGYMVSIDVVTGCTVSNTTISAYRDLGGIVGYSTGTVTNNTVKDVTLIIDKDPAHNYENYQTDAEHDLGQVVGDGNGTVENNTVENVTESEVYVIRTAAELKAILESAGAAGAGNSVINLIADVDLTGETWTPVTIDGYHGADVVTINGNGHTISGLTDTLFAGGFAGNSGIVINDLTIKDANITSSNDQGYGAFINCVDSMPKIELNNCHLIDSTITDAHGARVGGLIGWTAGYNDPNDGPVDTYITINNCSVIGCTITANGSVGAIIGHAGSNPATYHTITNCTVKNNTLTSTYDGDWRVGVVVGTANCGEVTISNTTSEGNTLSQTGKTAPEGQSNLYGRFVPNDTGKLTING